MSAGKEHAVRRLMVFGKRPRPGRVKTRLAPALGERAAAALYAAFLDDVLARCRAAGEEPELWLPAPGAPEADDGPSDRGKGPDARDGGEADRPLPRRRGVAVRRQPDGGLGERLRAAFGAAFREGARRAVVVGSDHPTLPPSHLRRAFGALGDAGACVGPTMDGGYWGVGLRADVWPRASRLFESVPWSTPEVLDTTVARAEEAEVELRRLDGWYDVDDPSDLPRLRRHVRDGSATAAALERLDRRGVGPAAAAAEDGGRGPGDPA